MTKKYQIFISSTYRDLETERRVVFEQILNMSHIPIGMELFQAADESQWSYIKKRISESDYYVVIVAERYGSEGNEGKSYTQMEYEYALEAKVPVIAFLLHEDGRKNWPKEKIEINKIEKIESFRQICESRLCKHWKNADDLAAKVSTSLYQLITDRPRTGWVRGDMNLYPEIDALRIKSEVKASTTEEKIRNIDSSDYKYEIDFIVEMVRNSIYTPINCTDISTQGIRLEEVMKEILPGIGRNASGRTLGKMIQIYSMQKSKDPEIMLSVDEITKIINTLEFYKLIEINNINLYNGTVSRVLKIFFDLPQTATQVNITQIGRSIISIITKNPISQIMTP